MATGARGREGWERHGERGARGRKQGGRTYHSRSLSCSTAAGRHTERNAGLVPGCRGGSGAGQGSRSRRPRSRLGCPVDRTPAGPFEHNKRGAEEPYQVRCIGTASWHVRTKSKPRRYWKAKRRARAHLVDDGAGVERVEHLVRLLDQKHVQLRHDAARCDTDDEMITRGQ